MSGGSLSRGKRNRGSRSSMPSRERHKNISKSSAYGAGEDCGIPKSGPRACYYRSLLKLGDVVATQKRLEDASHSLVTTA